MPPGLPQRPQDQRPASVVPEPLSRPLRPRGVGSTQAEAEEIHGELIAAASQWRGGIAHRVDTDRCPRCNSSHYMTHNVADTSAGGVAVRGKPAAPSCFECGYNGGLFDQTGNADVVGIQDFTQIY